MILVVTEKASVAKSLRNVLGNAYHYLALSGHVYGLDYPAVVADLPWSRIAPASLLRQRLELVGLKNPGYRRLLQQKKQRWEEVILALDPDTQGYTIASDVATILGQSAELFSEVALQDLSPRTIRAAFSSREPFKDKGTEGDLKRRVDFLLGTVMTRAVSLREYQRSKRWFTYTVGRVQSPTLASVHAREEAQKAFTPERVWHARLGLESLPWTVDPQDDRRVEVSLTHQGPVTVPPFSGHNTDSLIIELSKTAAFRGRRATRIAKVLEEMYLAGQITYPRTDNQSYANYPALLHQGADAYTLATGRTAIIPRLKRRAATDHGPITLLRVGKPQNNPEVAAVRQALLARAACIYSGSNSYQGYLLTVINAKHGVFSRTLLVAKDRRFEDRKAHYDTLPDLPDCFQIVEGTTKKPPSYSFGTLLKHMSSEGIGTKSTRSTIIENLLYRKLLCLKSGVFATTASASNLLLILGNTFLVSSEFTRDLETVARASTRDTLLRDQAGYRDRIRSCLEGISS